MAQVQPIPNKELLSVHKQLYSSFWKFLYVRKKTFFNNKRGPDGFSKFFLCSAFLAFKMIGDKTFLFEEENDLSLKNDDHIASEDYFKGVYGNIYIQLLFFFSYSIFCLCISGTIIVIWFERSGQAGNYRTLLNRQVSFIFENVRIKAYSQGAIVSGHVLISCTHTS